MRWYLCISYEFNVFNTAHPPHGIIHGGSQNPATSRINRRCVYGGRYGRNYYHLTEASASPDAFSLLRGKKKKKKEEVPAQLAFCNSNHLRPPGYIPSQGQQLTFLNAGTLQSIEVTTDALSLLALRCEKKGKCFLGGRRTERIELFNRNPQSLGAIWPGRGPEIGKRKMEREYKV